MATEDDVSARTPSEPHVVDRLVVRPMNRSELDVLVDWAAAEGWNPGLHDADIFWATDPEGFVAADLDGEMIGGGSIVSYDGEFGFMGFFVVRPDRRGRGLGRRLWETRKALLVDRLEPGAAIGMDGVYEMQRFYARGGFRFCHRDIRFEGAAAAGGRDYGDRDVVAASSVDFATLDAYDRRHFPAPRPDFLRPWLEQDGGHTLVALGDGERVTGLVVSRPCRVGHKIGPLFADDPLTAERLFDAVCAHIAPDRVQIDVPECNLEAMRLAGLHGLIESSAAPGWSTGPSRLCRTTRSSA